MVLSDQVTKLLAVQNLAEGSSVEVLGRLVMFTLIYNEGGAMGTSFGSSGYYLISSMLILGLVLYYIHSNRANSKLAVPLAFIAGGAVGNVIDRLRLGRVIDFLDVDFFDVNLLGYQLERWWTFNLADTAITCAIIFLLIQIFMPHKSPGKPLA